MHQSPLYIPKWVVYASWSFLLWHWRSARVHFISFIFLVKFKLFWECHENIKNLKVDLNLTRIKLRSLTHPIRTKPQYLQIAFVTEIGHLCTVTSWGTSINDVPRFLAFFDLPTYLCPIWSLLEKAAYLMTSFFVWPTLPKCFFYVVTQITRIFM